MSENINTTGIDEFTKGLGKMDEDNIPVLEKQTNKIKNLIRELNGRIDFMFELLVKLDSNFTTETVKSIEAENPVKRPYLERLTDDIESLSVLNDKLTFLNEKLDEIL